MRENMIRYENSMEYNNFLKNVYKYIRDIFCIKKFCVVV